MTPRTRSQDLAADLMHDIAGEDPGPSARRPATVLPAAIRRIIPAPSAVVETALFLAPKDWVRPSIARSRATVLITFGPVRIRIGRG